MKHRHLGPRCRNEHRLIVDVALDALGGISFSGRIKRLNAARGFFRKCRLQKPAAAVCDDTGLINF